MFSLLLYSEIQYMEKYMLRLHLKEIYYKSRSGNVLQGIAYRDDFRFFIRALNDRALLIDIYIGRGYSVD